MRWKIPAGVLMALALLIPAAPALAQTGHPGLDSACQTVERKVYKDIRDLITIDLDTASNTELRVLTAQILAEANAESLPVLPDAIQKALKGSEDELRAFLKTGVQSAWSVALRVTVVRTLTDAGPNVQAATQKVLDDPSIDAYLVYLNYGLYIARELDCASTPTPTPTPTTAQPTPTPTPTPTPSTTTTVVPTSAPAVTPGAPGGGEGGGLPVTGTDTATVAGIGGVLLLLGGAGFVIGRRRRSRFVA
ncbi:ALF repeat-containing protein [Micromonospora sp. WMMD998]|uniref:ALF repeat-containing protein n=1 Tax=Micromonospora sp. WMMD998 TaxID=3016092 RepID=UPI00249B7D9C|nr:ALF repeat-containing protein [Micromonospora sp. WMMD998]WFE41728.1 ALF repeat-containing protein [Micromonospora sp. WMMD998]